MMDNQARRRRERARKTPSLARDITARRAAVSRGNGPFAASGHMVHAGGQAAHWDIQNKANSNLS